MLTRFEGPVVSFDHKHPKPLRSRPESRFSVYRPLSAISGSNLCRTHGSMEITVHKHLILSSSYDGVRF
jgi:hypothetical protein